jgi:transcriptional regulator with XRE-family HTH domain
MSAREGGTLFEWNLDDDELTRLAAGRRIAEARRARGFTQIDLARRLGVSVATVDGLEAGHYDLKTLLLPLGRALGRPPVWFVDGDDGGVPERVNGHGDHVALEPADANGFRAEIAALREKEQVFVTGLRQVLDDLRARHEAAVRLGEESLSGYEAVLDAREWEIEEAEVHLRNQLSVLSDLKSQASEREESL